MTYAIKAPARYAQGAGELANLGRSAKKLGNKFLVICTDNSRGRFGAQVEASLAEQEKEVVFTTFHGEATKDEVFAKMDECMAQGCDVVVGMGGGKALDPAKAVAENLGLPCVIIPTVASNDAPGWSSRPCSCGATRFWFWSIPASAPTPPGGSLPPAWATRCPPGLRPGPARTAAPAPWPGATCPTPG